MARAGATSQGGAAAATATAIATDCPRTAEKLSGGGEQRGGKALGWVQGAGRLAQAWSGDMGQEGGKQVQGGRHGGGGGKGQVSDSSPPLLLFLP